MSSVLDMLSWMPAEYPGGDGHQATGNQFLEHDLRVLPIKVLVKTKGTAG